MKNIEDKIIINEKNPIYSELVKLSSFLSNNFSDKVENIILLVEPDTDNRKRYMHYKVPAGGVIEIGKADYAQIRYEHQYVHPQVHLRIRYLDDNTIWIDDCESDVSDNRKNYAYLNKERIDSSSQAIIGDTIFLFGLKILLGPDFIALNNLKT